MGNTPDISSADKSKLEELQKELANINKKKEEYVAEHPEQRKLVYRPRKTQKPDDAGPSEAPPKPKARNLFNKKGLPRHPERSIYYDPVFNRLGVPPPGMPYMERREFLNVWHNAAVLLTSAPALRDDEVASEEEVDESGEPHKPTTAYITHGSCCRRGKR